MGLISNIVDFVFPIQRRLYHPTGRFVSKPTQFRSPIMQRRFARNRLWLNQARLNQVRIQSQRAMPQGAYPSSTPQFRRPLERTLTQAPMSRQVQPTQKRSFWSEMFSPNINPPLARPQPKRTGFGSTALNLIRWNNMFRR